MSLPSAIFQDGKQVHDLKMMYSHVSAWEKQDEEPSDIHAILCVDSQTYLAVRVKQSEIFPPVTHDSGVSKIQQIHTGYIENYMFRYAYATNLRPFKFDIELRNLNDKANFYKWGCKGVIDLHLKVMEAFNLEQWEASDPLLCNSIVKPARLAIVWDFRDMEPVYVNLAVAHPLNPLFIEEQRGGICNLLQMTNLTTYYLSDGSSRKTSVLYLHTGKPESEERRKDRVELFHRMYLSHHRYYRKRYRNLDPKLLKENKFISFCSELAAMRY